MIEYKIGTIKNDKKRIMKHIIDGKENKIKLDTKHFGSNFKYVARDFMKMYPGKTVVDVSFRADGPYGNIRLNGVQMEDFDVISFDASVDQHITWSKNVTEIQMEFF